MTISSFPFLSLLIWAPLVAAVITIALPTRLARAWTIIFSLFELGAAACLVHKFDSSVVGYQFTELKPWIQAFGIHYAIGIDGISLYLVALTAFLMPLIFIASQSVHEKLKGYLVSMLILESAMMGTLMALDLFLFYVFWEAMLAPMYFIIGVWGGKRRIYATLKFVLYTVAGSVLMFIAMFYTVWSAWGQMGTPEPTFLLSELMNAKFSVHEQWWLFGAFLLAFGIKVPLFPFHTWLPDAHVEAPTGGSVVLAGVMLKMGIYGFLRFAYPLYPIGAEQFAMPLAVLAVVGIVYGALVAWVQVDMKKLVAYSSVSHLGYCVLGMVAMNSMATTGSVYQMLNHGISTGALFLLVGVLYDRTHSRMIADYGGIAAKVPVFAFLFLVFTLSSIALPLTNGFIGEFLILSGSFMRFPFLTMIALLGVILGAVYMLTLYLKTMFGPLNEEKQSHLTDVVAHEKVMFVPLLLAVFVMGIFPELFLKNIRPSVDELIRIVEERKISSAVTLEGAQLEDMSDTDEERAASDTAKSEDFSEEQEEV